MRYIIFSITLLMLGCKNKNDIDKETKAIQSILERDRTAHFSRIPDLFISGFADSMISVNRGIVRVATPGERKKRISEYFSSVEFIKWDDVAPPIIRFSDDLSMAWAILQKQVILSSTDSTGKKITDTADYAWLSVFRKYDGEWKGEVNVSTNK